MPATLSAPTAPWCTSPLAPTAAESLAGRDEELDELHAALIAELASGAMTVPVTMELTLVARSYERLGDHAVNVATRVRYLAGSAPD